MPPAGPTDPIRARFAARAHRAPAQNAPESDFLHVDPLP
jgi:citrate lyase subunit beta / citryl-CoA lyase